MSHAIVDIYKSGVIPNKTKPWNIFYENWLLLINVYKKFRDFYCQLIINLKAQLNDFVRDLNVVVEAQRAENTVVKIVRKKNSKIPSVGID